MERLRKIYLLTEFTILFVIVPIILFIYRDIFAFKIVPIVFLVSILSFFILKYDKDFDKTRFFNVKDLKKHLKWIFIFLIILGSILAFLTFLYLNSRFLAFPKTKPYIWLAVMFLYPILAAYPQEVIFRGFFFHRYKEIFTHDHLMILINAICFGFAHIVYANAIAPILSIFGGFLFAYRYVKSNSILIAAIEHALWGNLIFTIGLGWYFYSGSIR